jgi:hypothetical protein
VELLRRVRGLFHRDKLAAELDEELRYHLAMREEVNRRAGLPQSEARLTAQRSFGNLTLLKESTREADLLVFLETVLKDIHFAARMLAKHPGIHHAGGVGVGSGIGGYRCVHSLKTIFFAASDAKDPGQSPERHQRRTRSACSDLQPSDFEFYRT